MGKYALLLVSALIFSMITYSYALRNALFISNTRTVQSFSQNQAHNIAQSAAMMALNNLRGNENHLITINEIENMSISDEFHYPTLNNFEEWPDLEGAYNLRFVKQTEDLFILESTGRFEDVDYRIRLGLSLGSMIWDPEIDKAVHAEESLEFANNFLIEGGASTNSISSGAVNVRNTIPEGEQLLIGPGGYDDRCDGIVIGYVNVGTGTCTDADINALPAKLDYPMPDFPAYPEITTQIPGGVINNNTVWEVSDYENRYINTIDLRGNSRLSINVGDQDRSIHVSNFEIGNGTIEFIGEGSLTIYVENSLDIGNSSKINEDGDVNNLMLYYRGEETVELGEETVDIRGNAIFNGSFYSEKSNIVLNGTSGIQGNVITGGPSVTINGNADAISRMIYAPNAHVRMNGNATVRGSIISDTFEGRGGAELLYDPELDADLPDLEVINDGFPITYWN